jgi:hypothetical protein
MRVAGTITSPAVMSAMRSTPSSMRRDSGSISSRFSASASVRISSALLSGPGETNSIRRSNKVLLSTLAGGTARADLGEGGSDTEGCAGSGGCGKNNRAASAKTRQRRQCGPPEHGRHRCTTHEHTLDHRLAHACPGHGSGHRAVQRAGAAPHQRLADLGRLQLSAGLSGQRPHQPGPGPDVGPPRGLGGVCGGGAGFACGWHPGASPWPRVRPSSCRR